MRHAKLISKLEKDVGDYPKFAYCGYERLFQRKGITSMKNCDIKFKSHAWESLKENLLRLYENVKLESLYVCSYCCPILNANNIPCCCVLNGVQTEPVPSELSGLDALSKQLVK